MDGPAQSHSLRHFHARIAQRQSAALTKRKSLVQSQVRAPINATLAQLEQSAGLRCRRPKVQVLHVAPHAARVRHCGVSSADQSSWFRPRRPQVRVLHAAPIGSRSHRCDQLGTSASSHSSLVALPRKQMVGRPTRRFESFTRRHTHCSHRLVGQDASLSRRELGFESP